MQGGYQLIEAESAVTIAQYAARWADLLEIESSAVICRRGAVSIMSEARGVTAKAGAAGGKV